MPHSTCRIEAIEGIPVLEISDAVAILARQLVSQGAVPSKAAVDAIHIAVAVTNGMDYRLTWNCSHIANAAMRTAIDDVCRSAGYEPAVICTPEELMEVRDDGTR